METGLNPNFWYICLGGTPEELDVLGNLVTPEILPYIELTKHNGQIYVTFQDLKHANSFVEARDKGWPIVESLIGAYVLAYSPYMHSLAFKEIIPPTGRPVDLNRDRPYSIAKTVCNIITSEEANELLPKTRTAIIAARMFPEVAEVLKFFFKNDRTYGAYWKIFEIIRKDCGFSERLMVSKGLISDDDLLDLKDNINIRALSGELARHYIWKDPNPNRLKRKLQPSKVSWLMNNMVHSWIKSKLDSVNN